MGTSRTIGLAAVLLHMATASAQTPYPELTIQDVSWMEGTHHYAVTNKILSPATPELPTEVGASADVEFVSATEVRLLPGFHAGGFNSQGQFHARIDQGLGDPADLVIISPAPDGSSPYGSIEDNVVHVHKWEKVEVGLCLPQEYQDAIDGFFAHYYSNGTDNAATPWLVDDLHDLNPYADDSLRLVMTLTRPDGSQTMKWGFFMREAMWATSDDHAQLTYNVSDPLHLYHIRFRFAPDMEGPWQFSLYVQAPFTQKLSNEPLLPFSYSGHTIECLPSLPDNHGCLEVNPQNRRTLQFAGDPLPGDEVPFFALGVNMGTRHEFWDPGIWGAWFKFFKRDHQNMTESMDRLHEVGANFMRVFMNGHEFAPEWVNPGVYDAYKTPSYNCGNDVMTSNCQFQSWAFDQLVEHARAKNVYLQLCVDPYPPVIDYEDVIWGNHAYVLRFLETSRSPQTGLYDVKNFFYDNGNSNNHGDRTVFYYWKRKYKYLMARWGYSVNIPIIEPFNEIDQMLTYAYRTQPPEGACPANDVVWPLDPLLPSTINSWLTDIIHYTRDEVNLNNPEISPLGEEKKLFLMSYTSALDAINYTPDGEVPNVPPLTNHFLPFTNELVDLIDVHKGFHPRLQIDPNNPTNPLESDPSMVDWRMYEGFKHATDFWRTFPSPTAALAQRKPFNHGEFNHYTSFRIVNPANPSGDPLWSRDVEKIFHNYDVSFHNELWAAVFSGKWAAGTTWHWERVFWFPDALAVPPEDAANSFQWSPTQQFSNVAGDDNRLQLFGTTKWVKNKRLHHHFQPLAELLNRPSVQELGIFSGAYTPDEFFDDDDSDGINPIECYYLRSDQSTAIGWVHNRNASVAKSFYVMSGAGNENFLGCTAPEAASITLSGFFPGQPHYITWFPTRIGATDLPPDSEYPNTLLESDANGDIVINLDGEFNGLANNYLDTLHSDYAFVITPGPFVKSLTPDAVQAESGQDWDFLLYPNPTSDLLAIAFDDETAKEVVILDLAGRRLMQMVNVTATRLQLSASRFAMGAYWVQVTSNGRMKTKKLIIH